jgi:hypothetical protein
VLEAELKGLTILSSAYSSVRGDAGLCLRRNWFLVPMAMEDCPSFENIHDGSQG